MAGSVGQYTMGWLTFVGEKSIVGNLTREVRSDMLGMHRSFVTNQNDGQLWDIYMDSVVWKIATINFRFTGGGIMTFKIDGSSVGTVDIYAAVNTFGVYAEITNISVATAGAKSFEYVMATKNASSGGYRNDSHSIALIRTGGTSAGASGTSTPGYTWQYFPWMGDKAEPAGTWVRYQDSGRLGGGAFYTSTAAQNDTFNTDFWMDTGTYTYIQVYQNDSGQGITTIQIDGSTVGTIDGYTAVQNLNTVSTISGYSQATAGIKNLKWLCATKNASASQYQLAMSSASWIRTGA